MEHHLTDQPHCRNNAYGGTIDLSVDHSDDLYDGEFEKWVCKIRIVNGV